MTIAYRITPELSVKLKEPFGELIQGPFDETIRKIRQAIAEEKPPLVISVGDTVSRNLYAQNIQPQIAIVDFKCMRRKIEPYQTAAKKTLYAKNPQGTITNQAIEAVKKALETKESAQIIVDGEEDLLTLIAVLYAPEKSLVVYGQPHEGIVIVRVTPEKKFEASKFLKAMEITKN